MSGELMPIEQIAPELWRISKVFGFHPPRNSAYNEETRERFDYRIRDYLSRNARDEPGTLINRRWVEIRLNPIRKPNLVDRERTLLLENVNDLTITWGFTLLRMGRRGMTEGEALNQLKEEVVWFLGSRWEYKLHPQHMLFCPLLNIWENHSEWHILRTNDTGLKAERLPRVNPHLLGEVCRECLSDKMVVHT